MPFSWLQLFHIYIIDNKVQEDHRRHYDRLTSNLSMRRLKKIHDLLRDLFDAAFRGLSVHSSAERTDDSITIGLAVDCDCSCGLKTGTSLWNEVQ